MQCCGERADGIARVEQRVRSPGFAHRSRTVRVDDCDLAARRPGNLATHRLKKLVGVATPTGFFNVPEPPPAPYIPFSRPTGCSVPASGPAYSWKAGVMLLPALLMYRRSSDLVTLATSSSGASAVKQR